MAEAGRVELPRVLTSAGFEPVAIASWLALPETTRGGIEGNRTLISGLPDQRSPVELQSLGGPDGNRTRLTRSTAEQPRQMLTGPFFGHYRSPSSWTTRNLWSG